MIPAEAVIEASEHCPMGAGRCGGGVAGNQYARGQMDNGASRMGQFAGQGNFGAIDSSTFAASYPSGGRGQMRMPPNMFYGSQFINQVQQCPPGANCAGMQPSFPTGQQPQQLPTDQGQMPPQEQMPSQDQGQMPPQDQGQGIPSDGMQDGTMPTMQDGSMPGGDGSQQKQQYCRCQQQQQYEQAQQQQQQYGSQYGGGMGGPSYGMPGGGPSYGMPGNMYMNMMQQGPYGNQPNFQMGMPPCARAAAAQNPWMNFGRGGPVNMQQIYG